MSNNFRLVFRLGAPHLDPHFAWFRDHDLGHVPETLDVQPHEIRNHDELKQLGSHDSPPEVVTRISHVLGFSECIQNPKMQLYIVL